MPDRIDKYIEHTPFGIVISTLAFASEVEIVYWPNFLNRLILMLNKMKVQNVTLKMLVMISVSLQLIYKGKTIYTEICKERKENNSFQYSCIGSIPVDLPTNISSVIVHGITTDTTISNLTFQGHGWQNVTSLQIMTDTSAAIVVEQRAFVGLPNLRVLRLHLMVLRAEGNMLSGLTILQVLDLSNTTLVEENRLLNIIGSSSLTNLQQLLLSGVKCADEKVLRLDKLFWNFVEKNPLRRINISGMHIKSFNLSSFYRLSERRIVSLKCAGTDFQTVLMPISDRYPIQDIQFKPGIASIQTIKIICPQKLSHVNRIRTLYVSSYFIFSGSIVNEFEIDCSYKRFDLFVEDLNVKNGLQFVSKSMLIWSIPVLHIQNMDMPVIEKELIIGNISINTLRIRNVQLEYIDSKAIAKLSDLREIDLSHNNLQEMNSKFHDKFGSLFTPFQNLQRVRLTNNRLETLPSNIFHNNFALKTIDLSVNKLIQLSLNLSIHHQLWHLDVSDNKLENMDERSMRWWDDLIVAQLCTNTSGNCTFYIDFHDNSFSCSSCNDFKFIEWIKSHKEHITLRSNTTCSKLNKPRQIVFGVTIHKCSTAQGDATKTNKVYKVVICVVSIIMVLSSCISCSLSRKLIIQYLKKRKQRKVQEMFLQTLATTKPRQCQYFVFLAYSSEDWNFVKHNFIGHLSEGLKARIGDNIEPVCTGDSNFRLGRCIQEEIITCIEHSKVVLILLTNNYCRSIFCKDEFQRAVQLNKPVIIMVKDKVDEQLMTDGMRLYYRNNTRIIWSLENGEYVLKCTWGNVIDSIVDMAMG